MSKKRRRERPTVDVQLVEIYEDLANQDEKVRLKAAHTLLTKFVSGGTATAEQLSEILKRLIRGVCSGRKAARLGFSTALTEFLTELLGPKAQATKGINVRGFADITELLRILVDETNVSGNVSGQEERDHHFGRLFGAEAIIKSDILFQATVDTDLWSKFLEIIFELAKRKPWLREEGGFVLFKAVQALKKRESFYVQLLIDKLHVHGLAKTPEGVAIWIAAKADSPGLKFPANVWKHDDPLDRKETSSIARILKEGAITDSCHQDTEAKAPQQGFWNTKMHFAWDVIIARLINEEMKSPQMNSKGMKTMSFEDFWRECVDSKVSTLKFGACSSPSDSLFATVSSNERKYWGFTLSHNVIYKAPASLFPSIFTKNFIRCLKNQLGSSERFLHRAAERTIKSLLARTASDPELRILALRAFLTEPFGEVNFDKITKTKTVETLLSQISKIECGHVMTLYEELILRPGIQDEKVARSRRTTLADQLVSALRNQQIENTDNDVAFDGGPVIHSILELLTRFAYFDFSSQAKPQTINLDPPFSSGSQQIYRARISSCLVHLLAKSNHPAHYAYGLITTIRGGESTQTYGKPLIELGGTVSEVVAKAWDIVDKTNLSAKEESSDPSKRNYLRSLTLLYSLTILQIYNEDPEALGILEELNDIFEGQISSQGPTRGPAALVEILLSFTSKPSQLFHRVAQDVFMSCAADVDEAGLESMVKVLETKENMTGQEQMFTQDNEYEDVEEESSEASDVEGVDLSAAESATSPSEVEEDDDDTDAPKAADEELAAFDAKLAQALGTRPGYEDLKANDNSSSDEDMDDDQMEALDEHLEKVFRERRKVLSEKTVKKDAKETIVNFKCRVLELLELFVKQQHAKPLALTLLLPVLTAIRTTTSPLVSSKGCNLIREFSTSCKGHGLPNVEDADILFNQLQKVHVEASKEASNAHASACSQASLLIARILVAHDRDALPRVAKTYAATWERTLCDPSYKVKASFFTDCQTWCTTIRK